MPHATHALCYYHLAKNIRHCKEGVKELFQESAYAYDRATVDENMTLLKSRNGKAWKKLMEIGVEKWARPYCSIKRYNFLTSNVAESFNSRLKWATRLPICSLLESTRIVIDEWISEKRDAAVNSTDLLSEEAHKRVAKEERKARRHIAKKMDENVYKIRDGRDTLLVQLHQKTCEYGVFQIDKFPCSHAIAAIIKTGRTIHEYVGDCYTREALMDVYFGTIHHLPPKSQWNVPQDLADLVVLPPIMTRQMGRPRQSRVRGSGERAKGPSQVGPSGVRRKRKPKKCSICGAIGHTRRKCTIDPDSVDEEQ